MKKIVALFVFILIFSFFVVPLSAMTPAVKMYDYDQYQELVQNSELPDLFVPYERWETFGEFRQFIVYPGYVPVDWAEDYYSIDVTDSFHISIHREPYLEDSTMLTGIVKEAAPENWLLGGISQEKGLDSSCYNRSGIYYVYRWISSADESHSYEILYQICWVEDGNFFTMRLPEPEEGVDLETYLEGADENHPLRTLLSPDATDHDVMVALGILEPDPPLFETWEIVTLAVGGTVVLAGVVTLIVLLVPKKKKPVEE